MPLAWHRRRRGARPIPAFRAHRIAGLVGGLAVILVIVPRHRCILSRGGPV